MRPRHSVRRDAPVGWSATMLLRHPGRGRHRRGSADRGFPSRARLSATRVPPSAARAGPMLATPRRHGQRRRTAVSVGGGVIGRSSDPGGVAAANNRCGPGAVASAAFGCRRRDRNGRRRQAALAVPFPLFYGGVVVERGITPMSRLPATNSIGPSLMIVLYERARPRRPSADYPGARSR
jgi:hypothetical protein